MTCCFRRQSRIIVFLFLGCWTYLLLNWRSAAVQHYEERGWVIHNGFCVRPYLHAGSAVTRRLLSDSNDHSDLMLSEMPIDDPGVFQDDLTLLAHSSASALDEAYLSKLLANWRGPISLAVSLERRFNAEHVRQKIASALQSLQNPEHASRFAVHVLFQRQGNLTCAESEAWRDDKNPDKAAFSSSYPINTVRNVARLFSSTRYIAFTDADFLFSTGFHEKMLGILRKHVPIVSKNALLYRIFEVDEKESESRNHQLMKANLKELIDADKARVFKEKRWPQGHSVPMLPAWLKAPESSHPGIFNLTISLKKRKAWEFQFAALRNVPLYDENFPYRVDNNLELRWEVCRAGYRLLPVEDLFVYHTLSPGEQDKDDRAKKNAIKKKNYKKMVKAKRGLVKRMQLLYPDTKNECPV